MYVSVYNNYELELEITECLTKQYSLKRKYKNMNWNRKLLNCTYFHNFANIWIRSIYSQDWITIHLILFDDLNRSRLRLVDASGLDKLTKLPTCLRVRLLTGAPYTALSTCPKRFQGLQKVISLSSSDDKPKLKSFC